MAVYHRENPAWAPLNDVPTLASVADASTFFITVQTTCTPPLGRSGRPDLALAGISDTFESKKRKRRHKNVLWKQ